MLRLFIRYSSQISKISMYTRKKKPKTYAQTPRTHKALKIPKTNKGKEKAKAQAISNTTKRYNKKKHD